MLQVHLPLPHLHLLYVTFLRLNTISHYLFLTIYFDKKSSMESYINKNQMHSCVHQMELFRISVNTLLQIGEIQLNLFFVNI